MPRKEYKLITVKVATFQRFLQAAHKVKSKDPEMDNSKFLDSLLSHKKSKWFSQNHNNPILVCPVRTHFLIFNKRVIVYILVNLTHSVSRINAIVIDDNVDVRDLFVELLEIQNVNVIGIGSNGKEAYDLYQKHNPDIVFIDAIMPDFDGFFGMETIMKYDPKAIVVLITGAFTEQAKINQYKPTAIVEKPLDMNEIKNVISKFCIR